MIVSTKCYGQCDTNSICTKKKVLIYLYKESSRASYLQKDTILKSNEINQLNRIIILKDSVILNNNKAFDVCKQENGILKKDIQYNKNISNKLHRRVILFQITTLVASVTTLIAILK